MSQQHQLDEERIFHVARGLDNAELRDEYLTQVCAGDQALRERVEELLEVYEKEQTFLKSQPAHQPTELYSQLAEGVGQQIGRFKLLQKIGEGGFGVVYLAEQSRPVRRKVALKVIKPGMDTSAVVARFEAERQALALMDHPNIAKVLDGGATESGRPYFVMELVKGVPITQFCDENKFSLRERLELFTTVCRAIQHAHQKGIIHRDIKPSNVLVTLHDGKPVPKVIDFGVSKAISQQLTEKTLFTAHGQMIGTPQYMSPEQAEMSGLDIDTRSDIYSLGILLYELLTGVTPLDPEKLRSSGFLELQRLIREDEPVQPSRRCSTLGEQTATIATQRKTDPNKLGSLLRGELDWIVMKTLEKDRNRRYETPDALAKDVENYLNDETVDACPPSIAYRFQKFARRNKSLLLTGTTIAVLLFVSTLVSTTSYLRSIVAIEDLQEALRENSKLRRQQAIEAAFSAAASNQFTEAQQIIQEAKLDPDDETQLDQILVAQQKIAEGNPSEAVRILKSLKGADPDDPDVMLQALLANAYLDAGDYWSYFSYPVIHGKRMPETPYEFLFVGASMFWMDFPGSIEHLDEAVKRTTSPLSFTCRARSRAYLACSLRATEPERSLELIESAVEDIETARRLYEARSRDNQSSANRSDELPVMNPSVQSIHLQVLLHAHSIYQLRGLKEEAAAVMEAAEKLVAEIPQEKLGDLQYVKSTIGFFHLRHAEYLKAQGMSAQAADEETTGRNQLMATHYGAWMLVADLIRLDPKSTPNFEAERSELLQALNTAIEEKKAERPHLMIALYHLLKDSTSGRSEIYDLINRLKLQPPGIKEAIEICQIYTLLGDLDACHKYAEDALADAKLGQVFDSSREGFEYYAGKQSSSQYLENRENTGAATYRLLMIGLTELAEGNREEAFKRFEQDVNEGIFHAAEYVVAEALYHRMKNDRNWLPPWLMKDKHNSED